MTGFVAIGVIIGVAGAVGVGRVLSRLLVQTGSTDPVTLAGVAVVLLSVSVTSCVRPAYRATPLDPAAALRRE